MTALAVAPPAWTPVVTPPADERLYDWSVVVPGETTPVACGIAHTLDGALQAARYALADVPHATVARVWAADLGLSSGRGYRRDPWPRWTVGPDDDPLPALAH